MRSPELCAWQPISNGLVSSVGATCLVGQEGVAYIRWGMIFTRLDMLSAHGPGPPQRPGSDLSGPELA